jgi:ribosome-binding protein aMBF1 (putative translation factor)
MARSDKFFREKASVSSGDRGRPIADLFAHIERTHPGIEEQIGLSSAALKAGQIVRTMRKANGWTQTELATQLGWDQERISNIERGEGTRGPTFDVMIKIATACGYVLNFSPRSEMIIEAPPEEEKETETYTSRHSTTP